LLTWRTHFFGTTVTEYMPAPVGSSGQELVRDMLQAWGRDSRLLIAKDIPEQSPLLSEAERSAAEALIEACKQAGFIMVAGQALAYVPVDFRDEDDYLSRLSSGRRKNIRRKLRSRADLRIEVIATGDPRLNDSQFLNELYELYLEVYAQSEIHFDKLTAGFFAAVLQDASLDGHLFLYSAAEKLIGFNLCFIHKGMLIDKYVGFSYPAARDHNLYFVSWMENLSFAVSRQLTHYVAGWTDPEIKSFLGARFTFTQHAVYLRNPILRRVMGRFASFFEHDKAWFEEQQR
jgi:predicted N-acyltransferase